MLRRELIFHKISADLFSAFFVLSYKSIADYQNYLYVLSKIKSRSAVGSSLRLLAFFHSIFDVGRSMFIFSGGRIKTTINNDNALAQNQFCHASRHKLKAGMSTRDSYRRLYPVLFGGMSFLCYFDSLS